MELPPERPGLNKDYFKMAAPGTGVVVFRKSSIHKEGDTGRMSVLLSVRSAKISEGQSGKYGYTGGGFVDCDAIAAMEVGEWLNCADEAYRESGEENGGFEAVITRRDYFNRAQSIATFVARTPDINEVHACTVSALGLDDDEWDRCLETTPSEERDGDLREAILTWRVGLPRRGSEQYIHLSHDGTTIIVGMDFFHVHEIVAFGSMAWHADNNKLW